MGQVIRWQTPDPDTGYTTTYVESGTSQLGPFSVIGTLAIGEDEFFDPAGTFTTWYRIRFYNGTVFSTYSSAFLANRSLGYTSVYEVRTLLKLQPAEYPDSAIEFLIRKATLRVEDDTGRTWRGLRTVSNERYDGNGTHTLYLNNTDIRQITAFQMLYYNSNSYQPILPSQIIVYEEGKIELNLYPQPITFPVNPEGFLPMYTFPYGHHNIIVSYICGNQKAPESIKQLCLLYIAQFIKEDPTREKTIEQIVNKYSFKRANLV